MSLTAKVDSAVAAALVAAGDLAGVFTLRRRVSTFNPATSTYTETVTDYVGTGVIDTVTDDLYGSTTSERRTMLSTDTNPLIQVQATKLWLRINSVTPVQTDTIIMPDNVERAILQVRLIKTYSTVFIYELTLTS